MKFIWLMRFIWFLIITYGGINCHILFQFEPPDPKVEFLNTPLGVVYEGCDESGIIVRKPCNPGECMRKWGFTGRKQVFCDYYEQLKYGQKLRVCSVTVNNPCHTLPNVIHD